MVDLYPHHPGAKGDGITRDTSEAAADAIGHCVGFLQTLCLRSTAELGDATPLEVCAHTGFPRESLQPRFSELRKLGLIEPTGEKRRNPSGRAAAVLALTDLGDKRLAGDDR